MSGQRVPLSASRRRRVLSGCNAARSRERFRIACFLGIASGRAPKRRERAELAARVPPPTFRGAAWAATAARHSSNAAAAMVELVRHRLVVAYQLRGRLPALGDVNIVAEEGTGALSYRCTACSVDVGLVGDRLFAHFSSAAHHANCSPTWTALSQAQLGERRQRGGGPLVAPGASGGASAVAAPVVPPLPLPAGAGAGAGPSAGADATAGAPPADAGLASQQAGFLRELGVPDAEARWWRVHSDERVECLVCGAGKVIVGGGQYRSTLKARVSEHRSSADHSQQLRTRRGQTMLSFGVAQPHLSDADRVERAVDRLLLSTPVWCRGYAEEEVTYKDKSGEVQFVGSPMHVHDVLEAFPVEGVVAVQRYGPINTAHYRSEGCMKSPSHFLNRDQVQRGVQSVVCVDCARIPTIPAFKKRLLRAHAAFLEEREYGYRARVQTGGFASAAENKAFLDEIAEEVEQLKAKVCGRLLLCLIRLWLLWNLNATLVDDISHCGSCR